MTLLVVAVTATGLYFAQRNLCAVTEQDVERDFRAELSLLHSLQ